MTVIHLHNLTKRYRGRRGDIIALGDVNLSVPEGEFLTIRGPSGSGKSTLLLTIAGMIHPTDGKAVVNSTDIYAVSGRQRARFRAENIGFVFQMFHLVPYLSVLDNVVNCLLGNSEQGRLQLRGQSSHLSYNLKVDSNPFCS